MQSDLIAEKLVEGTILEGPHFGEPVRVLLAKARGDRVEIVAEGVNTKQTWKKLLKVEDFESSVTIKSSGGLATARHGLPLPICQSSRSFSPARHYRRAR